MKKGSEHFYQLLLVFGTIIIFTQFFMWGDIRNRNASKDAMMSGTMGDMMSSMHLKNIGLKDLFKSESENRKVSKSVSKIKENDHSSMHGESGGIMKNIHYVTTISIIILLPIIIAGAAFLAIMWIK